MSDLTEQQEYDKRFKEFFKGTKKRNRELLNLIDKGDKLEAGKKLHESLEDMIQLLLDNPSRKLQNQPEDSLEKLLQQLENEREFPD
jgi:hypothetical protein